MNKKCVEMLCIRNKYEGIHYHFITKKQPLSMCRFTKLTITLMIFYIFEGERAAGKRLFLKKVVGCGKIKIWLYTDQCYIFCKRTTKLVTRSLRRLPQAAVHESPAVGEHRIFETGDS